MPYVNIKITKEGNVTPEQKAQLISGVTGLLADVLHKNPATTVVVIDEVPLENWGLGGDPILVAREKRKNKKAPGAFYEQERVFAGGHDHGQNREGWV